MSVPTFIVGTGRCGSTMLSNMLRQHPQVLSISELLGQVTDSTPDAFPLEPIEGREFWAMLAGAGAFNTFSLRHGIRYPEYLYPFDSPAARFSAQTDVPIILLTALPHLTDEHDTLYDVLHDEVTAWSTAAVGEQYRRLFGWLQARFARRLWVERSALSLTFAEQLLTTFPDGRFVHIVRDGRDAALSMREHLAFRLLVILGSLAECLGGNPLTSSDRSRLHLVPSELRPFLPETFDIEAFRAFRVPLTTCGAFWARQIESGLTVLNTLPEDRLLTLRYEDFFQDPKGQLDLLAGFLEHDLLDEGWSAACAATVRPPRSTWRDLPDSDARALTEACRPGFEQLGAAGVNYAL